MILENFSQYEKDICDYRIIEKISLQKKMSFLINSIESSESDEKYLDMLREISEWSTGVINLVCYCKGMIRYSKEYL